LERLNCFPHPPTLLDTLFVTTFGPHVTTHLLARILSPRHPAPGPTTLSLSTRSRPDPTRTDGSLATLDLSESLLAQLSPQPLTVSGPGR
jgi:hypothetical protein